MEEKIFYTTINWIKRDLEVLKETQRKQTRRFDEIGYRLYWLENRIEKLEQKHDKSDLKWCNTCKHGDEDNWCNMVSVKPNELKDWLYRNSNFNKMRRTIDDVKESCPCYEPRVKKNCDSCVYDSIDGDGDRQCKVMVSEAFNSELCKWITKNCSRCGQCRPGADNCPAWKPKE